MGSLQWLVVVVGGKQRLSGADQGSAPSTPESHSAATPAGGPSNGRRQSGAGDEDWAGGFGLPPPAGISHAGSVSSLSQSGGISISPPMTIGGGAAANGGGGPPKAVRKNADGDEVDDEGFIVTKQRGFDESTPQHTQPTQQQRHHTPHPTRG